MKQRFELLKSLQSTTEIPFCIINNQSEIALTIPDFAMPELMSYAIGKFNLAKCDENHPFVFTLQPTIFVGVSILSNNSYLILGPCMPQRHQPDYLSHFLFEMPFRKDHRLILESLQGSKLMSLDGLCETLCLAHFINTGVWLSSADIKIEYNIDATLSVNPSLTLEKSEEAPVSHGELPRGLYAELGMNGILNLNNLFKMFHAPTEHSFIQMSSNHDRQSKYIFMIAANEFCREAVKQGVGQHEADSICARYCQKADLAPPYFDVRPLYVDLLKEINYAVNMSNAHHHRYSPSIAKCVGYIHAHISERIYLKDLSTACNLSERWLSKCFRREVGMPIPDYINQKKLARGAQLLRHTNRTVDEISSFLNFSNTSYFCKLFKRVYGVTPAEYRFH